MLLDLRQSFRALLRAPGFSVLAILVLALGLGANLLLFNAVQALLWRPLPFPEPQRLVYLQARKPDQQEQRSATGYQAALLREQATCLTEVGLVKQIQWDAPLKDRPDTRLSCTYVSSGYFRALGLRPLAGQLFSEVEDRGDEREPRAVITEKAWRQYFAANPALVGQVVQLGAGLERGPVRIIGILAGEKTFPFTYQAHLLFPIATSAPKVHGDDANGMYRVIGRLKPGATMEQASTQIQTLLREENRRGRGNELFWVEPLRKALQPSNQGLYLMLLGASGLLLLLTATNAASLFLARALARSRETALRLALGAGLSQLLRAQLREAALVCGAGLVLAFGLNAMLKPQLLILLPELRRLGPEMLSAGPILLGFGLGMTLVVCGAVSLMPLLQAHNPRLTRDLAQGNRSASGGASWGRNVLVAAQVAVILVLLSMGALLTRSLGRALQQGLGFDPRGVQVCTVELVPEAEQKPETISLNPDNPPGNSLPGLEAAELVAALPGSLSATFAWKPPFDGSRASASMAAHEGDIRPEDPAIPFGLIGPDYFRTLSARLLAGREFARAEVSSNAPVAVLNRAAAQLLFPGQDPVGKTFHSGFLNRHLTVVGLCEDLRTDGLDQAPSPMVYLPFLPVFGGDQITLMVRTSASSGALTQALRERLRTWNSAASLQEVQSLESLGADTVRERLRAAALVGTFAILGLCIGCIGLYGTLSAQAARGRREVGIRMALGSTPLEAAGRILAKGLRPLAIGALLGLGAALLASRLLQAQLYGIETLDATSHLAAIGLLALGSALAFLVPVLRASRVPPAEALRSE